MLSKAADLIYEDHRRYQWLKNNCLEIVPESRDGPEYPRLRFSWDLYEYYRNKDNYNLRDEFDKAIDNKMGVIIKR